MWTPERILKAVPKLHKISRRLFLRSAAGVAAATAAIPLWLVPQEVRATEEWVSILQPWQDPEWFPMSLKVAANKNLHTLYEQGGPLDVYDYYSALAGVKIVARLLQEMMGKVIFLDKSGHIICFPD